MAWVVPGPDDIVVWWAAVDDGRWTMDEGRSWLVRRMSSLVRRRCEVVDGPVTLDVSSGIWTISSREDRERSEMVGIATFDGGWCEVSQGII